MCCQPLTACAAGKPRLAGLGLKREQDGGYRCSKIHRLRCTSVYPGQLGAGGCLRRDGAGLFQLNAASDECVQAGGRGRGVCGARVLIRVCSGHCLLAVWLQTAQPGAASCAGSRWETSPFPTSRLARPLAAPCHG